MGVWVCINCGYQVMVPIYAPPLKCPKCGAEYEIVKILHGAHIAHDIPVTRLKGSEKLNVVLPIAFAVGHNESAVREYFEIVKNVQEIMKTLKRTQK